MENLVSEACRLARISAESLASFLSHRERLLEQVDSALLARSDIAVLLGGNPSNMVSDNHRHHFDLMVNVFEFQAFDMLVRIVPSVYHAYICRGFSPDYFLVEFEAWMAAIKKCLEEEGEAIIETYAFMRENHARFLELAFEESREEALWDETDQRLELFYHHLLAGDFHECFFLGQEMVKKTGTLESFYLDMIQPAMYRIGREWETGKISIAKEHLASAVVMRLLASIYSLFKHSSTDKGTVLVTALPNEYHVIGAWMVANILELDGWKTLFLGANTPVSDMLTLVHSEKPRILALSITMPFNLHHGKVILHRVRELPATDRPLTMVGGQVFRLSNQLQAILAADGYASCCTMAREIAHKWWMDEIDQR